MRLFLELFFVYVCAWQTMSSPPHHTQAYLDADKGPTILGLVITVSILSTIFVAGRVYTRKRIIGALHLDDWFTIVAVVCSLALCICVSLTISRSSNGAKSVLQLWLLGTVM